jgi:hypothetical protein
MCGAEAGFAHDKHCPYPYYGRDEQAQAVWMAAYERIRAAHQNSANGTGQSKAPISSKDAAG